MVGKEETPKCRKKTVTWTNEMIEDLIDFIEIHPIVAFEAIYEPMQHVVVIMYIHKLMLIRILSSDWSISIQVPKIGCISIPSKSVQVF
jgi:tRNA (Thr-GGU) A37 N-methylase